MVELISVHVPKTAGTAFRHILLRVYGIEQVQEDYPPNKIYNPGDPLEENIKVIHGHFSPVKYQGYFPNAKRIVWLRNPIFRLISEYFYALTIKDENNVIHRKLIEENLGILEFSKLPAMQNFQSKKLQGMNLKEFDFVGLQEFYAEDLKDLKTLMGWSDFTMSVQNSNQYPDYYQKLQEILNDYQLMNQLAIVNSKDMELYQEALNLRVERRKESKFIQCTLAEWSRSQFIVKQLQDELHKTKNELQQAQYWLQKTQTKVGTLELVSASRQEMSDLLWAFSFDSPKSPIEVNGDPISIRGWVIGKNSPVSKVVLTCDDQVLNETLVNLPRPDVVRAYSKPEANNCGFETQAVLSGMLPQSELIIRAVFADNSQVKLGAIQHQV